MANVIRDHILELQFSDKKVVQGITKIERLLSKLGKSQGKANTAQVFKKENKELDKQNRLLRARQKLRNTLLRAEKSGISPMSLGTSYSTLKRTKDPSTLARAELKLQQKITELRREQFKLSQKSGKSREKFLTSESAGVRSLKNRIKNLLDTTERQITSIDTSPRAGRSTQGKQVRETLAVRREALTSQLQGLSGGLTLAALRDVEEAYRNTARGARALSPEINRVTKQLTAQQFVARGLKNSIKNLVNSYASVFAVAAGAIGAYNVGENLESVQASFLAATGDPKQALKDWGFIETTSKAMGGNLSTLANGYQKIATSAKAMGFTGRQAKDTFLAGVEASKAFGLGVDDTAGVLRAFDQILSKSSVQMEELKGQLGDRLPGALAIAARAMKMNTDQLSDMIKRGELASSVFMPRFVEELRKMVRESGALEASMNSVKTAREGMMAGFQVNLFKSFSKASGGIKSFFNSLSKAIFENTALFEVFGTIANGFFRGLAVVVDPVSTILRGFGETIKSAFEIVQAGQSLNNLRLAMDGVGTATRWVVWAFFKFTQAWYYLLGALVKEEGAMEKLKGMFSGLFGGALSQAKDMLSDLKAILKLGGEIARYFEDHPMFGGAKNSPVDRAQQKFKELQGRMKLAESGGKPAEEQARASMQGTIVKGGTNIVEVVIGGVSFTTGSDPKEKGRELGIGIGEGIIASGSLP